MIFDVFIPGKGACHILFCDPVMLQEFARREKCIFFSTVSFSWNKVSKLKPLIF